MPAPPMKPPPPPQDVLLRLSPDHPSMHEVEVSRSFSRMSSGRTSVAEYRSDARAFLDRYTPGYDGDAPDELAGVTYDPKDPWSSPRGQPRPSSPLLPARNFKPGLSTLAARVRQRELYVPPSGYGEGKKVMLGLNSDAQSDGHEHFFYELDQPKSMVPDRVADLVARAKALSPDLLPHPRRRKKLRPAKLPELKTTPRLAKKLSLLREGDDDLKQPVRRRGKRR